MCLCCRIVLSFSMTSPRTSSSTICCVQQPPLERLARCGWVHDASKSAWDKIAVAMAAPCPRSCPCHWNVTCPCFKRYVTSQGSRCLHGNEHIPPAAMQLLKDELSKMIPLIHPVVSHIPNNVTRWSPSWKHARIALLQRRLSASQPTVAAAFPPRLLLLVLLIVR